MLNEVGSWKPEAQVRFYFIHFNSPSFKGGVDSVSEKKLKTRWLIQPFRLKFLRGNLIHLPFLREGII